MTTKKKARTKPSSVAGWIHLGALPVDATFLVVFRCVLAVTFFVWAQGYLDEERYRPLFIEPQLLFKYAGFRWVKLWPVEGIYWHFRVTQIAAVMLLLGILSRPSAAVLSLSMTYVLLVERQIYNNHDYLLACAAAMLVFLPASCKWSVDQCLGWQRGRRRIPRWHLWMLRFQLGMPYAFGAIAKLNHDWLHAQPAEFFLLGRGETPVIGPLLVLPTAKWVLAYGGILFDAMVVPMLLSRKTRWLAVVLALMFHLTNATLFRIGVFPWFMLATLYVFFPPEFLAKPINRFIGNGMRQRSGSGAVSRLAFASPSHLSCGARLALLYVAVQLILPVRPWVLPGDPSWNERGHRFAWRMMLRHKETLTWFKIENDSDFLYAPSTLVMTPYQSSRAERDPELIRQAAVKIKAMAEQIGQPNCRVYALALVSLNGRRPVPIIDPDVDLATAKRGWFRDDWVNQDPGKFLDPIWHVPKEVWWTEVQLPERFAALQNQSVTRWTEDFRRFAEQQRAAAQSAGTNR